MIPIAHPHLFNHSTPSTQPQKTQQPRKPKRKDTQVPQSSDLIDNVADEAVHKELGDSLVRAATTASSLEAEQDNGNINKTQSKATPNGSSSQGTNSGGPWCQETMGDTIAQTRFESVSKHSNDSLLARGNTLQSDEDRLKLEEWMALCTTLKNHVLDLEKIKTTQHNEIASLKRRVKKLEKKDRLRTYRLKRLYKFGLTARVESSDNEESLEQDVVEVINTTKLIIDAAQVSASTTTTATIKTIDDITLPQVLEEMKSTKPKKKGIVIQELGESTTTISSQLSSQQSQDKAEFDEEERLAREKAKKEEANIALIKTWDDIQAKIDADHQLAKRMQAQEQEQEELSIEEKATLFQNLLEKRRKHFAAKRAEEKRNKPPTKAQQNKDEVAIDAIPLAVKSPIKMLKSFDNEDLEYLYKLVKAKYESTIPMEYLDLLLWGDMKIMFEPHVKDKVWRNQQEYKVLNWKLHDSCGVHSLMMQHVQIYMLVEKKYPLAPLTLSMLKEFDLLKWDQHQNSGNHSDGRVIGQHVQGRQTQSFVGTRNIGIATTSRGNYAAGQANVVKCYNCPREGNMAKQCTQPKMPRSYAWFKEKLKLAEAQEAAFQIEDLDAYDLDCDDISSAKAVLMENISSCNLDVLSEESQYAGIQDTSSSAPNDLLVLSLVEQMTDHVSNLDKENQTNKMVNESLTSDG
ncbi:retrovirus-related pol polyprotein from transposon TNT 1-94 [Tanacetum coccineum]